MNLENHKFANLSVLALLAVGLASAGALQSFGIITGTADVDPAVEIKEKDLDSSEVTVEKNVDSEITEDDKVELTSEDSCDSNIVADNEFLEISEKTKDVEVDSEHADTVYLCIQEVNIDEE